MKFDPKAVLNWFKRHWAIPSLTLFILVVLGTTWWFSSGWNASIKSEQERAANDKLTQVKGMQVTYALPAVGPDGRAIELRTEPNAELTRRFAERKAQLTAQGEGVVKLAEAFNKGDKKPLVDGLFPQPAPGQEQRKPLDLAAILVGDPDRGTPSAYQALLDSLRAGGPVSSTQLTSLLEDLRRREEEKVKGANTTRALTPTETEAISRLLLEARRSEYQRRANGISVYADKSVFPQSSAGGAGLGSGPGGSGGAGGPGGFSAAASAGPGSQILTARPTTPPSVAQAFLWQADYWLLSDLLGVVRQANTGPGGRLLPVREALVKRIDRIELLPWKGQSLSAAPGGDPSQGGFGQPSGAPVGEFGESITNRSDATSGGLYDVRRARVQLVVSSSRLPQLFDAIARTNMISVTGMAAERVDPWRELEQGYFYGDEPVVRVMLDLEFVWLRLWTEPLMPLAVRRALGLPDPAPPADPNQPPPG